MSASLQIVFLDSESLGEAGTLEGSVRVFLDAGFVIDELLVDDDSPGQQQCSFEEAMARARLVKGLSFRAYNSTYRLDVRQQIAWGESRLGGERRAWVRAVTDNTPYFWRPEYGPAEYSRLFLDIDKGLYAAISPSFGWVDFDQGALTTHEDIELVRLPALYWANFFGPLYVARIGRDRITSAPAWAVEELPDGGLVYLLASCPGLAHDHVPPSDVRRHFGVSQVR